MLCYQLLLWANPLKSYSSFKRFTFNHHRLDHYNDMYEILPCGRRKHLVSKVRMLKFPFCIHTNLVTTMPAGVFALTSTVTIHIYLADRNTKHVSLIAFIAIRSFLSDQTTFLKTVDKTLNILNQCHAIALWWVCRMTHATNWYACMLVSGFMVYISDRFRLYLIAGTCHQSSVMAQESSSNCILGTKSFII